MTHEQQVAAVWRRLLRFVRRAVKSRLRFHGGRADDFEDIVAEVLADIVAQLAPAIKASPRKLWHYGRVSAWASMKRQFATGIMNRQDDPVDDPDSPLLTTFNNDLSLTEPEFAAVSDELRRKIEWMLTTLQPKEALALRLRILSEEPMTLRQIGELCNCTGEQIRKYEAMGLRKFRHPSRSTRLNTFLYPDWVPFRARKAPVPNIWTHPELFAAPKKSPPPRPELRLPDPPPTSSRPSGSLWPDVYRDPWRFDDEYDDLW